MRSTIVPSMPENCGSVAKASLVGSTVGEYMWCSTVSVPGRAAAIAVSAAASTLASTSDFSVASSASVSMPLSTNFFATVTIGSRRRSAASSSAGR